MSGDLFFCPPAEGWRELPAGPGRRSGSATWIDARVRISAGGSSYNQTHAETASSHAPHSRRPSALRQGRHRLV